MFQDRIFDFKARQFPYVAADLDYYLCSSNNYYNFLQKQKEISNFKLLTSPLFNIFIMRLVALKYSLKLCQQNNNYMDNLFQHSEKVIANPEQSEELRCRICYDTIKPLISVCGCSGSIAYVHEECVLDWITKKIESADRVEIPSCQVCHERFSARMKVGKKKICSKLLFDRIIKTPKIELIWTLIHALVFIFTIFQLLNFTGSIFMGSFLTDLTFKSVFAKVFTNFICQIYVISFFVNHLKSKQSIIYDSMVQIVEVTLKPKTVIRK